jgi:hypothetical protein
MWAIVAGVVLTGAGVFVLPWMVPVPLARIVSDSQALGFNNRLAILSLLAGCVVFGVIGLIGRRMSPPACEVTPVVLLEPVPSDLRVSRRVLWLTCGFAVVVVGLVAHLVGPYPFSDSAYFVDKLLNVVNGSSMNRDFEFSYGPLFLYPPYLLWLAFKSFGLSIYHAYFVFVGAIEVLSILISTYLLNRLTMSFMMRRIVFGVVSALVIVAVPTFGPNYSALRFLMPFAMLIWTLRNVRPGISALVLPSASVVLGLLVSPEVGIVTALSIFVAMFAGSGRGRLTHIIGTLLGLVALIVGMFAYASSSGSALVGFVSGNANYPVFPGQPALFFVLVMLAVCGLSGYSLTWEARRLMAPQIGWVAASIIFIAPALGRSDWIHLCWNGFGAFLLLVALLELLAPRLAYGVTLTAAMLYVVSATTFLSIEIAPRLFVSGVSSGAISEFAAKGYAHWVGREYRDGAVWYKRAKIHEIGPFYVDWLAEQGNVTSLSWLSGAWGAELAEMRVLKPMYEPLAYVGTQAQLDKTIDSIDAADYMVVPRREFASLEALRKAASLQHWGTVHTTRTPRGALVGMPSYFPLNMQPPNPILDPYLATAIELHKNWEVYLSSGDYLILRHKGR